MINILYCFDENYNRQTYISIYSILRLLKPEQKIRIYVIHKNPDTFEDYANHLLENENLDSLNIFKFNDTFSFPNVSSTHVSEATYYRLLIENYLPEHIDNILYLDADVIALNSPYEICENIFRDLMKTDHIIGVSTEIFNYSTNEHFQNIELCTYKYFNAGVMFINYKNWKNSNLHSSFSNKVEKYKDVIKLWDQDILNNHFQGDYMEISTLLNFRANSDNNKALLENNIVFYHFSGDHKPWLLKGSLDYTAKIFFDIYFEISGKKYFFTRTTGKSQFLKTLFNILLRKKFWLISNKRAFITEALKNL